MESNRAASNSHISFSFFLKAAPLADQTLTLSLIEDLMDIVPIDTAEILFEYLESRFDKLTAVNPTILIIHSKLNIIFFIVFIIIRAWNLIVGNPSSCCDFVTVKRTERRNLLIYSHRVQLTHPRPHSYLFIKPNLELLRRVSKANNTVFCGRVLMLLSSAFPASERSGKKTN